MARRAGRRSAERGEEPEHGYSGGIALGEAIRQVRREDLLVGQWPAEDHVLPQEHARQRVILRVSGREALQLLVGSGLAPGFREGGIFQGSANTIGIVAQQRTKGVDGRLL